MKLYIVIFEGLVDEMYATARYLLGVFNSEEKANAAIDALPDGIDRTFVRTHVVNLNDTLEVTYDGGLYEKYRTDICVGSYYE